MREIFPNQQQDLEHCLGTRPSRAVLEGTGSLAGRAGEAMGGAAPSRSDQGEAGRCDNS